ncbi:unnamed protein product [Ectocarpus sp. 6 AP-2014]
MFDWFREKKEAEKDPCLEAMGAYVRCVEGKTDGLREGDECTEEVEAYKNCRQLVREAKKLAKAEAAVPAAAGTAADDGGKQQPR